MRWARKRTPAGGGTLGPERRWRSRLLVALLLANLPGVVHAQQQEKKEPPKTPQERVLERLRSLPGIIQDTTTVDTTLAKVPVAGQQGPTTRGATPTTANAGNAPSLGATDSIAAQLLRIPGFVATQYHGDSAYYQADSSKLTLSGKSGVSREGQSLTADSTLVYYDQQALFCGYGKPVLSGSGAETPVTSDSICYNIDRRVGRAYGAQTNVNQGADWRVRGEFTTVGLGQGMTVYGHDNIFTDCNLDVPHYYFKAKSIKAIQDSVLVARSVTLNFRDVPVFWLPFMVQSLSQGRRSGVLMPRFGLNDIARTNRRYNRHISNVGFYLAINNYLGVETTFEWFANNYTALGGSIDYRFLRQFLQGGLSYSQYWKQEGGKEFTMVTQNSWQPDERTTLTINAQYSSSTQFIQQRSFDPRELNRSINSAAGMTRRFDWGSLQLSANRQQYLNNGTVTLLLPSLSVNLSPITLFEALPGEGHWFSNATVNASGGASIQSTSIAADNPSLTLQGNRDMKGNLQGSFSLGQFSWSQSFQVDDALQRARDFGVDSIASLPEQNKRTTTWTTSFNFQQRLVGTSTFTPSLSLSGGSLRADTTHMQTVAQPLRMNFGATLRTDLYGFFPGIGPFQRIRHRISPSITYTYSPKPTANAQQRLYFPVDNVREQNRLSIGLSQTIEAKYKEEKPEGQDSLLAPGDTSAGALPDTTFQSAVPDTAPKRRQEARKIKLLSLSTDAVVYDFVKKREDGQGIVNTSLTNSIQSDLLQGLQLSITHDLFRTEPLPEGETGPPKRRFAPRLSRVSAAFSLNSNSGLIKALGLGPKSNAPKSTEVQDTTQATASEAGPTVAGLGLLGSARRQPEQARRAGPVGQWNASFTYTLVRPSPDQPGLPENQMLQGNVSFQPTINWSLQWTTGYSFTTHSFADHVLTLRRSLHDWDANFDFVKAQNGNFTFQFRVQLRANPDIKFDYDQNSRNTTTPTTIR